MAAKSLADKPKNQARAARGTDQCARGYLEELGSLPEGVSVATHLRGRFDWVQVFAQEQAEVERVAPKARASLAPDGLLWMSFPKGSSKIQTDLTRDKGWESLSALDLKWVTLVSVNAVWSAFALRPYSPAEVRQSWR